MKKTTMITIVLFVFTALFFTQTALAGSRKKAVVLVVNSISLKDFVEADTVNIDKLLKSSGAIGLMNTRAAIANSNDASCYLALGMGAKTSAGNFGANSFNSNEKILFNNTIMTTDALRLISPPLGGVATVNYADIVRNAKIFPNETEPGFLGEALKKAGLRVGVLGNADVLGQVHREAALITMNKKGLTPSGDVDTKFIKKGSWRTDYDMLFNKTTYFLKTTDFLVVELGDTARLKYLEPFLTDKQIVKEKKKAIEEVDIFLDKVAGKLDLSRDLLIMVTPKETPKASVQRDFVSPLLIFGPGYKGTLYSNTTKWEGYISGVDFVPTILGFFDPKASSPTNGAKINSVQKKKISKLLKAENKAVVNDSMRVIVYIVYVTTIILVLIVSGLSVFFKPKVKLLKKLQFLNLFIISLPLVLLLVGALNYATVLTPALLIILGGILFSALVFIFFDNKKTWPIVIICGLTVIVILLDLTTGSNLTRGSLLGYSPLLGFRFYGLGNEYEGVLIGAAIMALGGLADYLRLNKKILAGLYSVLFSVIILVITLPFFGADVGGGIAGFVGFAAMIYYLLERKITWRESLYLSLGVVALFFLLIGFDGLILGGSTHAGKLFSLIKMGNFGQIQNIIWRKMQANVIVSQNTPWTKTLVAIIILIPAVLLSRSKDEVITISKKYPRLVMGLKATLAGGVAAFFFNDSGTVPAATSLLFAAGALMYVIIGEKAKFFKESKGV